MKKVKFVFSLLIINLLSANIRAQNPREIVKKSDEKLRGVSGISVMRMEIIRPKWKRSMSLKSWTKGTDYSLVLITGPAKEKGKTSLKRKNELWSWSPVISRTIKVSPSMMMQSWMGSDFTNDDLLKQSSVVVDYTHKILGSEKTAGYDCHKIELIPKEEAAVVWGKIVMWISKVEFMQMKTEFYDEDGFLVSRMEASDVKKLGGKMLPARLEMIPVEKPGNKTVIIYDSIDFGRDFKERFFSIQNMKRVR